MSAVKQWYSAAELAAMKLEGVPTSERGIRDWLVKHKWLSHQVPSSGKKGFKTEFQPPKAIMQLIQHKNLKNLLQTSVKSDVEQSTNLEQIQPKHDLTSNVLYISGLTRRVKSEENLTDKDRAYRDSSLVICRAIDQAKQMTGCSTRRAIMEMASHLVQGIASPELVNAANVTYTKPRSGGQTEAALVSRLQKMYSAFEQGRLSGDVGRYLVAGSRQKDGHSPLTDKSVFNSLLPPFTPASYGGLETFRGLVFTSWLATPCSRYVLPY